jgi:hypothetical protein
MDDFILGGPVTPERRAEIERLLRDDRRGGWLILPADAPTFSITEPGPAVPVPDVMIGADPVLGSLPAADIWVVQCNFPVGTVECSPGARAYVLDADIVGRRVRLLARSRSGRWIDKWENLRRLTDFRFKTIPPEHTLYGRLSGTPLADEGVARLNEESAKLLAPGEG